jgi:hypothetical protein
MIGFVFGDKPLIICRAQYIDGHLALLILNESGEHYAVLSVNIPGVQLAPDEVLIKTWAENKDIAAAVLETGAFVDTGRRVKTGFVEAQVWQLVVPLGRSECSVSTS